MALFSVIIVEKYFLMVFSDLRFAMLFLEIKQILLLLILRAGHLIIGFWIILVLFLHNYSFLKLRFSLHLQNMYNRSIFFKVKPPHI